MRGPHGIEGIVWAYYTQRAVPTWYRIGKIELTSHPALVSPSIRVAFLSTFYTASCSFSVRHIRNLPYDETGRILAVVCSTKKDVMTLALSLAQVLAAHTHHCFGVMGEGNAAFLHHYEGEGHTVVPVRHEAAAVAAADAYYRSSGKLAVATTTYGAGFTNALSTLVEAHKARIPLIYVTGGSGTAGKPWDINEAAILTSLGIECVVASENPAGAHSAVALALSSSRPVAIIIPEGMALMDSKEVTAQDLAPIEAAYPPFNDTTVNQVIEALTSARNPLILAGRGVWAAGATESFAEIAQRLGAQVATTAAARNAFPGAPICGGFASKETAEMIRQADVILAVGASLTPFTMRFGKAFADDATLIHTTIETTFHPRANITATIDARDLTDALLAAIPASSRSIVAAPPSTDEPPVATDGRLHPADVAKKLDAVLPKQRNVVSDGGHFIGWPATYWDVPDPAAFIQIGTAFKAIGMGTGAAVGVAWARPDRTTVLVAGDGGLAMGLADLPTIAEAPGKKIVVIFNDETYGAEHHQFAHRGYSMSMGSVGPINYHHMANAVGASSIEVEKLEQLDGVTEWLSDNDAGMLIVNCHISKTVLAPFFKEIVERAGK